MTETEAKGKWCPQRIRGVSENLQTTKACNCIGSACMAWRWIDLENFAPVHEAPTAETDGYCGLAGHP